MAARRVNMLSEGFSLHKFPRVELKQGLNDLIVVIGKRPAVTQTNVFHINEVVRDPCFARTILQILHRTSVFVSIFAASEMHEIQLIVVSNVA